MGHGEDAEPLFLHHRSSSSGLLGVFDGLGGSGGRLVGRTQDGEERTSAWTASRCARAASEEWFLYSTEHNVPRSPESYRESLIGGLRRVAGLRRSKVNNKLRRELPTTAAVLDYRVAADRVSWQCLWAGDSRCFLLVPDEGLQQLSRDDAESADALVLLHQDPPMTNVVSADGVFRINGAWGESPLPAILLCATDGFFGYLETPALFEHVLLDTMARADTLTAWASLLTAAVASYTGDDATLALAAFGFDDYAAIRDRFAARATTVQREHHDPLSGLTERADITATRLRLWELYRSGYERRMPQGQEGQR
ncbi:serine/threonine protein phosphatase [Streptomyces sp. MBT65]|uniref:serine/threonine protein phosphatase n=1 Tax=Streptomyces sp. MBT65 TaxID=1488395 RepID=UPI00190D9376|nr:serine/threonine protein phosphatase [Streptomyces sp. MBT65]MBK3576285.1 serine/threonine protein phosphatase [Streptomyces sp. MBT65]